VNETDAAEGGRNGVKKWWWSVVVRILQAGCKLNQTNLISQAEIMSLNRQRVFGDLSLGA
jgi:hypothetical protein